MATYVVAIRREARSDTMMAAEWVRQVPGVHVKGQEIPVASSSRPRPKQSPRSSAASATRSSCSLRSATSAWTDQQGNLQRQQAKAAMKTERGRLAKIASA
jgi:hypothetical protein